MKTFTLGILIFSLSCVHSFGQGMDSYDKPFTKYDLYQWKKEMHFKPKYIDTGSFDDFILKLTPDLINQWHVELVVARENFDAGNKNMMFTIWDRLKEFYGDLSFEQMYKWYIPYYVFLQIDEYAKTKVKSAKN